jgi:peptidoglycan hydrolase-like protein with peptidoglycan-binding domain
MMALVVLVVLAVGVAVGVTVAPEPGPDIAPAGQDAHVLVGVSPVTFTDTVNAELAVTKGSTQSLASGVSGIVTNSSCHSGRVLRSGDALVDIDGSPVLALSTAVPFWRDLRVGDDGTDVTALQRELRRLGYHPSSGGKLDARTALAIKLFLTDRGYPTKQLRLTSASVILPRSAVVWMNRPSVTVTGCPVKVGDAIGAGQPLVSVGGGITQIAAKDAVDFSVAGARTLTVAGVTVPADARGVVANRTDVDKLLSSSLGRVWQDTKGGVPLTGTYALAKPLTVWSIPPAAVIDASSAHPCVIDDAGASLPVTVVSSILGRSLVTPVTARATAPQHLVVDLTGGRSCS